MRALSIIQPWPVLILIGEKEYETRTWPCPTQMIGEEIAIHASARFPRDLQYLCLTDPFRSVLAEAGHPEPEITLARGAVLGTARIIDCCHTEDLIRLGITDQEFAFGDFSVDRWGWKLGEVRLFDAPIPAKGARGLWEWQP